MMTREQALQLAAQAWCEPETSGIEMDARLATAFAGIMLREVQSAIAHLRQPEGWVSVEDRMPAPYEEVMVWPHPTDYCMTAQWWRQDSCWKYGEYISGHGNELCRTDRVTHWMPLPAAPGAAPIAPTAQPADAIQTEPVFLILFDDQDRNPELFAGDGATKAALHRFEQASMSWNAHLFAKVKSNTSDDRHANSNVPMPADSAAAPAAKPNFSDAYEGAREDLAIWKRRALHAESQLRDAERTIKLLGDALNDENGPTFMGEPVISKQEKA